MRLGALVAVWLIAWAPMALYCAAAALVSALSPTTGRRSELTR